MRRERHRRGTSIGVAVASFAGAVLLAGCTPTVPTQPPGNATDYAAAAQAARGIRLIDRADPAPPYARDAFGEAWTDIDGNGCSQRQDVLARDLVDVVTASDRCTVLSGTLDPDAYTGQRVVFRHDRIASAGSPGSRGVQIDHIVSLSAAHAGGAWRWSAAERERFANELTNLIAVDGTANEGKSNLGPSRWLPANPAYVCEYAAAYTRITTQWSIAVAGADRDRLVTTLDACAGGEIRAGLTASVRSGPEPGRGRR